MIKELANLFEKQKEKNDGMDEFAKLSEVEMTVDPEYIEMLN